MENYLNIMENLHSDVLGLIIYYLLPQNLVILRCTCKYFRKLIKPQKVSIADFIENIPLIEWATSSCETKFKGLAEKVAKSGNLPVLEYLYENDWSMSRVASAAALNGHIHILKWVKENSLEITTKSLYNAQKMKHHNIITWIIEHYIRALNSNKLILKENFY